MPPSAEATTSGIDTWADDSVVNASPVDDDALSIASEDSSADSPERPLLVPPEAETWTPPVGFVWIQVAIMLNVFLNGFDGTITAATYAVISSEFDAANTASWLTTSYLVTAAAFQPLYGRVSDIFGRRVCFFVSTVTFAAGCLGCGVARDVVFLNIMRALTGFGGGGLMTMATIVNSDMIPFRKRGMYQAMQNGIFGFGAIAGASFGGTIADHIGWRWCFLLQVPVSVMAFVVGWLVLKNQSGGFSLNDGLGAAWKRVDVSGALLLVAAISIQLVGLSLGGNELPWTSPWVIGSLVGSVMLFAVFFRVEATTSAIPVIPLRMLKGRLPVATQIANVCAGMAAYAYLFMLPLFFQVVLQDSATTAGARLAIPSLATPIGGLVAGIVMSRWGRLIGLMRCGVILMTIGNALVTSFGFTDPSWKYFVYIFPANLGQGIVYPSILFTSLASFTHSDHAVSASTVYLVRSLGTVWGVSITSAIVQTSLSVRLPDALGVISDKWTLIDKIRHSVDALDDLPPELQLKARHVYYEGIQYAFAASTAIAAVAVVAAFVANGTNLRKTN
ncbi:hypothetical protein Purlil1_2244 [Purpureocillium lilacinum]|uniref:Major facilitator superfamily (MFS) profile domain-containing protein n=1 Tax=Purpureocillium lilacinum TaxID=33203 RepID=A0ABR0CA53_PURLI|nr:hypothetical protein Purlil1_2244 [Purpureocillium lilacinum]